MAGYDHFFLVTRPVDTISRAQLALKSWLEHELALCLE